MGVRLSRCAQCNGLLAEGEHRGSECDVCMKPLLVDGTLTYYCPKDEFEVCSHCFKCFYFEKSVPFHAHSKWKEITVHNSDEKSPRSTRAALHCSYCQSRIRNGMAVKCLQCKFLVHPQCFEMLRKATQPHERWQKVQENEKKQELFAFRKAFRPLDSNSYKLMCTFADDGQQRIYVSDYLSSRILILHSKTLQPIEQWENANSNHTRFFLSVSGITRMSDRLLLFDRWLEFPLQVFSLDGRFLFAGGEHLATHSASCSNIVSDGALCYLYSLRSKKIEAFDSELQIRREFIPERLKEELQKLDKERYDSDKLPLLFIGQLNGCAEPLLGCWIEKKRSVMLFDLKSEKLISECKLQWVDNEHALSALFAINGFLYGVVQKTIVAVHLNAAKQLEEIGRTTVEECEDSMRIVATKDELICFLNSSPATRRLPISFDQPLPSITLPKHFQRTDNHHNAARTATADLSRNAAETLLLTTTSEQTSPLNSLTATSRQSLLCSNVKPDLQVVDEETKSALLEHHNAA